MKPALHQFALYQLKDLSENRLIRFRPYETLQKQNIQVRCENYEQKYIGQMGESDTPASIRKRFDEHPPRTFGGHSISVSDVLVLNHQGEVTAYYVEKEGFVVIAGFIRTGSSSALISFDTTDFHIEGKEGSWLAYDSIRIDGREFSSWSIRFTGRKPPMWFWTNRESWWWMMSFTALMRR